MSSFLTVPDKATIILERLDNTPLQVGETMEDMRLRAVCEALDTIEELEQTKIVYAEDEEHSFIDPEYR